MSQQYLYRVRPTRLAMLSEGPTEQESGALGEHFNYLQDLAAKGTVLMAGRTLNDDERTFGIVVFSAESEEAADQIMRNDPAVKQQVMQAELFPYRVAVWSRDGPSGEDG